MAERSARRGEPLRVQAAILVGWVLLRVAFWSPDDTHPVPAPRATGHAGLASASRQSARRNAHSQPGAVLHPARAWAQADVPGVLAAPAALVAGAMPSEPVGAALVPLVPVAVMVAPIAKNAAGAPPAAAATDRVRLQAMHQLLWMAAVSDLPPPSVLEAASDGAEGAARPAGATRPAALPRGPATASVLAAMFPPTSAIADLPASASGPSRDPRWSGDAWALWRRGGIGLDHGAILPAYGASQTGAVLRYRLFPDDAHRLDAYVRASAALVTPPFAEREMEGAVGLSARPVPAWPVRVAVEGRVSRFDNGRHPLRPAAFAITELPPARLPLGFTGTLYAAAGYVGGPAATAFADGQAHVDHPLARFGRFSLAAGGGAWGGAQQGANRLDLGPSLRLGLGPIVPGGRANGAVALDWRFRVAGDARPGSGPAVTLSLGF